jgi:hypothetical protein
MKLSDFGAKAVSYYLSGKSIYLKSGPGRGKTTAVIEAVPRIAKALNKNLGLSILSGPLLTPIDTVGVLMPKHLEDGTVESLFSQPFWFRTEEGKKLSEYDGGVIFVDEADKADLDVKKVLGEMALSGRCGPHKLPPGWVVWMAGNRAGDRSGSTKELDHLINRRFEIEVTDDLEGWKDWAVRNDVHYSIIAFADSNAQIVFPETVPEKQGPFCTPRSLVATGQLLMTLAGNSDDLPTDDLSVEVAAGGIGQAAAAQLMATLKLASELPEISTIISGPKTAKIPGAADAQMLTCYKLAMLADEKSIAPFITYVERLPADFAVTFVNSVSRRRAMLMTTPAMREWVSRNASLVNLMSSLQ